MSEIVRCNNCNTLMVETGNVLLTYPAQREYKCFKCGDTKHRSDKYDVILSPYEEFCKLNGIEPERDEKGRVVKKW